MCDSSCQSCGGSYYGCGADHCCYCGADWKAEHRPDCKLFQGCNHIKRDSEPVWSTNKQKWLCSNCLLDMPKNQFSKWLQFRFWLTFSGHPDHLKMINYPDDPTLFGY